MKRIVCGIIALGVALTLACGGEKKSVVNDKTQVYIVGSGIAGLSAAVFAIRDGKVPGKNIHIFEELKTLGGALDSKWDNKKNYSSRGARLINEKAYQCYWDMLSAVPTLEEQEMMEKVKYNREYPEYYKPKKTLKDEIFEFNDTHKLDTATRLVGKNGERIDHKKLGLSRRDLQDLLALLFTSEKSIDGKKMNEYFQPSFFKTNFWYLYASMFGFEPWHSLIECKRYFRRFFHDVHTITTLHESGWNTPYNNYESIVLPITKWLLSNGVDIQSGCRITDVDFKPSKTEKTVEKIHYVKDGRNGEIAVSQNDFVFISIGSKVADSREGGMNRAPELVKDQRDGGWSLWKKMTTKVSGMGNPAAFSDHVDQTKWTVFAVNTRGPYFNDMVKNYSRVKVQGQQHILSCVNSNWGLGMHVPFQPFYKGQPADQAVFLCYGLYGNAKGNYIKKTMTECTGEELLTELCYHLGFMKELPEIMKVTTVTPNNLPYATSQFVPRKIADRPPVVPEGSTNLALLGQYVEIPDDTVFMVDYSTRSAQIGVYKLLHVDKEVTPVYTGMYNPFQWVRAVWALLK